MLLKQLTDEQKTFLHAQVAVGVSVSKALDALSARWCGAHKYKPESARAYLDSEDGRVRGNEVLAEVRDKALTYGFADKGSRLALYHERALSLANQLRVLEHPPLSDVERAAIAMGSKTAPKPDPQDVVKLSAELRQTLMAMQKEMEPLAGAEKVVFAPIQDMIRQLSEAGATASDMRSKMETEEPEVPS